MLYYEQTAPSLDNGGRILDAVVRPYPAKTAGIPLRFEFEVTTGMFSYEWANPSSVLETSSQASNAIKARVSRPPLTGHPTITSQQTEIFVPTRLTQGRKLIVRGLQPCDNHVYDIGRQTLCIVTGNSQPGVTHKIMVSLHPSLVPAFHINGFWGDFGPRMFGLGIILVGMVAYWILGLGK